MMICLDGRLVDAAAAGVDPMHIEAAFTDAALERTALKGGRGRRFTAIEARLKAGAAVIGVTWSWAPAQIQAWMAKLAEANGHMTGIGHIVVGRTPAGTSALLLATEARPAIDVVCAVIAPAIVRRAAPAPYSRLSDPERIAAEAAARAGDAEATIVVNAEGHVAGTPGGDVFALVSGTLVTPPLTEFATGGPTRDEVIRLAHAEEAVLSIEALKAASEIAIADGVGVRPVIDLDGRTVGDGSLGLAVSLLAARI
jgi:branched-subunit amino acid aminotransferase/4-amino-4-deoxychorismate lyase